MAKKKEATVEKKLRALYDLQLIDSRIDEIVSLRGELPLEVEDLENEIKDLETKSEKIKEIVDENKKEVLEQKQIIENAKELHKKYEEKLKNVRNNREYNSIVKEQEFQDLESQLAEKKINEYKSNIEQKELSLEEITQKIKDRSKHLDSKKVELETKYLKDYPKWHFLSQDELEKKTIEIFLDIKIAKSFCQKEQKVIKVPNPEVFRIVAPILISRGITRIISEDILIAL